MRAANRCCGGGCRFRRLSRSIYYRRPHMRITSARYYPLYPKDDYGGATERGENFNTLIELTADNGLVGYGSTYTSFALILRSKSESNRKHPYSSPISTNGFAHLVMLSKFSSLWIAG